MNQDFTEKKHYLFEKKFVQRVSPKKKIRAQVSEQKKKFLQPENSPPPITFLMVRP